MFKRFIKALFKINNIIDNTSIKNTKLQKILYLYQASAISFVVLLFIIILKFIIWPLIFITKVPLVVLLLLLAGSYMYMEYVLYEYSKDIDKLDSER